MNRVEYEEESDRNEEEADSFARDEHALSHDSATDPVPDCWCCDEELFDRQEAEAA